MKSIGHFVVLCVLILIFHTLPASAQVAVNCDAGCGGTQPTTGIGSIPFRTAVNATRGLGSASRPSTGPLPGVGQKVPRTVQGSQSFTYSVPLFALHGRNGLDVDLTLYYNSFIWTVMGNSIVLNADHDNPSPGFRLDFGYIEFSPDDGSGVLVDATGAKHALNPGPTGNGFVTNDSTYIQAQIPNPPGTVLFATHKNGLIVTYNAAPSSSTLFRPAQFKDTNGNIFSIFYQDDSSMRLSEIIDDVGRKIFFTYDSVTPTQLNSVTEVSAGNVPLKTYTFSWAQNYPLYIAFTESTGSLANENGTNPSRINVLTGVTRPDGTGVAFNYADWGLVSQVSELSGNATPRYSTSFNWPIAGNGALSANPTYTQQTIFDGVNTGVWNYFTQKNTAGTVTNSEVTDPTGVTRATTFSAAGNGLDGVPVQTLLCSAFPCTPTSANILRTTNVAWALDASGANAHPTSATTILEDGTTQSLVKFNAYDTNGNLTDRQEFDFGAGAPGALLRRTLVSFAAPGSNIVNKPAQIIVQDGTGATVSRTDFKYDEGTAQDYSSNPAGHDPAYTSAVTARGNVTSVIRYATPAAGTGGITTKLTYDVTGNVLSSQQGTGPLTTFNFSPATWYAFPDSVSIGPAGSQLTTNFAYNDDGQVLTTIDANGQKTTATYDAAGRPSTTLTPDQVLTTVSYDDLGLNPSATVFSTANSLRSTSTVDGLGRQLKRQTFNGTSLVSTVSQVNDILGRAAQTSNPFGPSDTPDFTTVTYDNLGRRTQVAPPASAAGAQTPYLINYSGAVVTTTDPAGKLARRFTDALGRLVRADEPGSLGGATASTSATISGTDLSVASNSSSNGATAGIASITIASTATCSATITDRCNTQVVQQATASASITVKIGGKNATNCFQSIRGTHCLPDSGNFSFSLNIMGTLLSPAAMSYSSTTNSTTSAIAQALINSIAGNSVVKVTSGPVANADGSTSFTLATVATGKSTNSSTAGITFATGCVDSDTTACGGPGWNVSFSGPNLSATLPTASASASFTGGLDQILTTKYDTGTATVGFTVNNNLISEQVSYGQTDTAATLAQAFVTKFSQDSNATPYVTAGCAKTGCSDGVLNLTTVATGSGTNYPLTLSSTTNSTYFASGSTSFTATSPSSSFVPGQPGTLYDNGTVTATLNGFTNGSAPKESVNYSQGSTAAGIAASLVAKINADPLWGAIKATVPAGSATITFTASTTGTDANSYSLTISGASNLSSFPNPSFPNAGTSTPITAAFSGGSQSTPSLDPSVVLTTAYTYDPLGHLLQVQQGQQTRTYSYDGLGHLLSAQVPETNYNAITFTYKDFGLVATKTDPRGITTTYTYDSLIRPTDVKYSDGTPEVTFAYGAPGGANNGGGRLISTVDGSGSKSFQYDIMGKVTNVGEAIAGATYTTQYSYNAAGDLSSITYPSGRVVANKYDDIGRFTEVDTNGASVYSVGSYNAAGQILGMNYGNGMSGQYGYNSRLQLAAIQYGNNAGSILDLTYGYGGVGNDGQIQSITDNLFSARSTTYVYDELSRLLGAKTVDQTSAGTWKLEFTYDRYGNRLSEIPTGGAGLMPMSEVLADPLTNHLIGAGQTYDAAGNMTSDGVHSYTYDAEGRITHVDGTANAFTYDGGGFRVGKNGIIYVASGGRVIAEYLSGTAPAAPNVEYIYAGNQLVATIASGKINYSYSDHLSVRASADSTGTVTRTYGHFPFGETWYETQAPSKWKFTTYERDADSEGGLDYADARFDSTRIGRFMSLDPLAGRIARPQSLNRYTYVVNDPINLMDPTGADLRGNLKCLLNEHGDCVGGNYSSGCADVDGMLDAGCMGGSAFEGMGVFAPCPTNECIFTDDGFRQNGNLIEQSLSYFNYRENTTMGFSCTGTFNQSDCHVVWVYEGLSAPPRFWTDLDFRAAALTHWDSGIPAGVVKPNVIVPKESVLSIPLVNNLADDAELAGVVVGVACTQVPCSEVVVGGAATAAFTGFLWNSANQPENQRVFPSGNVVPMYPW
jgi:RHS repeat-associated protein